jgi:hypothetical protein
MQGPVLYISNSNKFSAQWELVSKAVLNESFNMTGKDQGENKEFNFSRSYIKLDTI